VAFNTVLAKRLPLVEGLFVICHVLGVVLFIPLWVLSPRRNGGAPLVEFYNPGGWSSNGVATMAGLTSPLSALIGFDCSVHMGKNPLTSSILLLTYYVAEETKDSSYTVPITLLIGYTVNVILGFFGLMTM
jgi:choline transport protein